MPRKLEDLTNHKYGSLTVTSYAGLLETGKQRQSAWNCKCDCGEEVIVLNNNLKKGNTNSCGCLQKLKASKSNLIDIKGNRFGKLVVVEYLGSKGKHGQWKCVCDCGNVTIANTNSLRREQKKSCGCGQGNFVHGEWSKGYANYVKFRRKDPIVKIRHNVSSSIRSSLQSSKNGSAFKYLPYTVEQLKGHLESQFEFWMNWDNYGGKSNDPSKTWHIDHIRPHASFTYKTMDDPQFIECWSLSNLRPLEKIQNIAKGSKMP